MKATYTTTVEAVAEYSYLRFLSNGNEFCSDSKIVRETISEDAVTNPIAGLSIVGAA